MDFAFPDEVLQGGISFKMEVEYDAAFGRIEPLDGRIKKTRVPQVYFPE